MNIIIKVVYDPTYLMSISRWDDVGLYRLREVFTIPHRLAKLP